MAFWTNFMDFFSFHTNHLINCENTKLFDETNLKEGVEKKRSFKKPIKSTSSPDFLKSLSTFSKRQNPQHHPPHGDRMKDLISSHVLAQ